MPFLSKLHQKTFKKNIRLLSKQTFTRDDKKSKVPSLLKAGLQILFFFSFSADFKMLTGLRVK